MIQRSTCKGETDRPMAAAPGTLTDYNGVSEALGRRRVRYVCRNVACQGLRRTGGSGAAGTVESVSSHSEPSEAERCMAMVTRS